MHRVGKNGLLVVAAVMAAAIVAGCDYYRDTNVTNNSDQMVTVRLDGFSELESEIVSVSPRSTVTIAHYGPGGNEPFLVREITIFGPDCALLEALSGADYQMDGGTITVGPDLKVQLQPGGRPQEAASPGAGQPCAVTPPPSSTS